MHRVVHLNSTGNTNPEQITSFKEEIRQRLAAYDLHVGEVNDGSDESGNPTLGINADFNSASEANTFHNWLKQYIADRRDYFIYARTRVHDCYHADGKNLPCKIGDVWELV